MYSAGLDRDGDGVACESSGDDSYDRYNPAFNPFYLPNAPAQGTATSSTGNAAPATREMQTGRQLRNPTSAASFVVLEVLPDLRLKGILNWSPTTVQLAGVQDIKGQEEAALNYLRQLLPPQSVIQLELTGDYKRGAPEGHGWLTSNHIGIMLVERGLALPAPTKLYGAELLFAVEFAKANKLGAYAEATK